MFLFTMRNTVRWIKPFRHVNVKRKSHCILVVLQEMAILFFKFYEIYWLWVWSTTNFLTWTQKTNTQTNKQTPVLTEIHLWVFLLVFLKMCVCVCVCVYKHIWCDFVACRTTRCVIFWLMWLSFCVFSLCGLF